MHALILSGLPGAGKSVFARTLADHLPGSIVIDVASVLQSWLGREISRADIGPQFVSQFGLERVPYAVAQEVNVAVAEHVIVDAVRHASSINKMREMISGRMTSIFVECEDGVRISRLRSRLSSSGETDLDEIVQKYMTYDDADVKSVCDYVIENSGGIIHLREGVAKFVADFIY